jgi:hypothetical protein
MRIRRGRLSRGDTDCRRCEKNCRTNKQIASSHSTAREFTTVIVYQRGHVRCNYYDYCIAQEVPIQVIILSTTNDMKNDVKKAKKMPFATCGLGSP